MDTAHVGTWQKWYNKVFTFIAKERITKKDIDLRKIHVHNAIVGSTAILMWSYAILADLTIASPIPGRVGYICSLLHLLSPLLFLVTNNMFIIASVCIGAGMVHQGTFSWYTGGFESNILIWFGILPLLAGMTVGKKGVLFWSFTTSLVAATFAYLHLNGLDHPSQITETGRHLSQGLIIFGWIFLSTALILVLVNLYQTKERLLNEQSNRVDDLFRVLFHDLANPIGRISIGINISKREENPELTNRGLDIVSQATDSMMDITQSVRKMYAVSKGKADVDLAYLPVNNAIEYLQKVFGAELKKKKLKLKYDFHQNQNFRVLVEPMSFKNQVLGNILSNAIKFSPFDADIEIKVQAHGTDLVSIEIIDHGVGMPEAILEHLFDITKKTTRPGTNGETGTGFGMSIMKSFIEMYQGKVSVSSVEKTDSSSNHGTTFKLTLKGKRES